jgi:DNA invertase Pin-like site-specific DNA recombinase
MNDKIERTHLDRHAAVYLRQSTLKQMHEHRESTARQYALTARATELGWDPARVQTIDEDLGQSGASTQRRSGFQRLAEDIAHGRVGAIFALEVSRLARSSADWHRLLELCGLADVVIVDEQAVYTPRDFNDRLLLGLKGTMSEAELYWMRLRLQGGKLHKARRGELFFVPPAGYEWDAATRRFRLDPDEQVQRAVRLVFARFRLEGSAYGARPILAAAQVDVLPDRHGARPHGISPCRGPGTVVDAHTAEVGAERALEAVAQGGWQGRALGPSGRRTLPEPAQGSAVAERVLQRVLRRRRGRSIPALGHHSPRPCRLCDPASHGAMISPWSASGRRRGLKQRTGSAGLQISSSPRRARGIRLCTFAISASPGALPPPGLGAIEARPARRVRPPHRPFALLVFRKCFRRHSRAQERSAQWMIDVLPLRAGSVAEERGNERVGIGRLGKERLLPRGELDVGWWKHPRPRPGHLGHAILIEQSPALVVGPPRGCSVHHRLGEQYHRTRRYLRNDHARGLFRGLVDLARQLEVTLVTPGNAPKSPVGRAGIGKTPGHDREPLVDAVGGKMKALSRLGEGVARRGPVVRVHGPHGLPLVHADPVETVQPEAVPEPKAKNRHDRLMIQQATERLPPVEEAMIRSVRPGGGAEANAFARAGEPLRLDQPIQLGQLRRPQDVVDHQIALKIEKVLLQLAVRSVHGHTLPSLRMITAASPSLCPKVRPGWAARQR